MKTIRSMFFTLGAWVLLGAFPASAATVLSVDARADPGAPETGYLTMGSHVSPSGHTIEVNNRFLTLDGKPWLPVAGEFHFTRVPHQYWQEELEKMKAAGVSIVSTYIFWDHHENIQGHFIWTGDRDLRRFVTLCQKLGFKVIIRPGPWVHSEARFGGLPDWVVRAMPTRSNDPVYLHYVQLYWTEVAKQLKGLLWKDGGPVIAMQLENEYNLSGPGRGGEHIAALRRIAREVGIDVPLYTATAWGNANYPSRDVLPMQGGYPALPWDTSTGKLPPSDTYSFRFGSRVGGNLGAETTATAPGTAESDIRHTPFLSAEFGGGIPTMYRRRPIMGPDDIAAMLPVGLGSGINLYGYYMFHGGENSPDRSQSLEENTSIGGYNDLPMIDYDFQAPLGAYGQQHAPMGRIRPIHYFLQAFGADLAPMTVRKPDVTPANSADLATPRFSVRSLGGSAFLFLDNYVREYAMADQKGVQFSVALPGSTVTFPSQPIDIPSSAYFIWPINMDLAGVRLAYATAEPITRLDDNGVPVYLFKAQDGIAPEFAFEGATVVVAKSGSVARDAGGRIIVSDVRAGTDAVIEAKTAKGGTVRLVVLSGEETNNLSLAEIEGRTRALLTQSQTYADSRSLVLLSTDDPDFRLSVYPALAKPLSGNLAVKQAGHDGVFEVFEASAPQHSVSVSLAKIRDAGTVPPLAITGPRSTAVEPAPEVFGRSAAWTITVSPDVLRGVEDAFLRIDARGDVGRLFSGAQMLDDQFFSGNVWEIGLKRFAQAIKAPLTITILPMRHDAPIYLETGVAKMVTGDQTAEVSAVSIVPQYRLQIDADGMAAAPAPAKRAIGGR